MTRRTWLLLALLLAGCAPPASSCQPRRTGQTVDSRGPSAPHASPISKRWEKTTSITLGGCEMLASGKVCVLWGWPAAATERTPTKITFDSHRKIVMLLDTADGATLTEFQGVRDFACSGDEVWLQTVDNDCHVVAGQSGKILKA